MEKFLVGLTSGNGFVRRTIPNCYPSRIMYQVPGLIIKCVTALCTYKLYRIDSEFRIQEIYE